MLPQPNQTYTELDTLTAATGDSSTSLVGVETFGSSSVLDDMAHAAVWLAIATGVWEQICTCVGRGACMSYVFVHRGVSTTPCGNAQACALEP